MGKIGFNAYNKPMKNKLLHLLFFVFTMSFAMAEETSKTILFLGDSLTEGYGVSKETSYPEKAKEILEKKGLKIKLLNGSISGSTTASSTSRLKWFLKSKPDLLFLALGANDGLRGIKVPESQKNLATCIELAQKEGVKVVLAGMMVPPNYGPDYGKAFKAMYPTLAKKYKVAHLPFLLDGVAGEKAYNQEDGIHPNTKGHEKMGQLVADFLLPLLKE